MSDTVNLHELERRAYREAQQDGIVEFALGITVLAWAAFVAFRGPLTAALVVALLIFQARGWEILRARYTYPRVGSVRLRREETGPVADVTRWEAELKRRSGGILWPLVGAAYKGTNYPAHFNDRGRQVPFRASWDQDEGARGGAPKKSAALFRTTSPRSTTCVRPPATVPRS